MKLVKIEQDKVRIKTNEKEFQEVRLNDLISVSDGEVELITMVTVITEEDENNPITEEMFLKDLEQFSLKIVECSILGSVIEGNFQQQIDKYPSTEVRIARVTENYFGSMIVDWKGPSGFQIGKYASYDFPAYIDGNKFYQRHSCIVGNTGCGKSETVAKIMEETASQTNCNMIVFDIHGEYGALSYVDSIEIGVTVPFPSWFLGFQSFVTNVLKVKEESTILMSALRKAFYKQNPKGNENKPCYFDFYQALKYIRELDTEYVGTGEVYQSGAKKGEEKKVKGDYNGKLSSLVNTMETLFSDKRYEFLFIEEKQGALKEFVNRIMGGEKPVKNVDLSHIPHEIAVLVIGAITKLVYHIQIMQKKARPMTLVCDEAHVYIPVDFQLTASQRRMVEIFEDIAKEGRKFGITLFVASQRPSELNKTIMAQCANYIVMKLNNENDKSMIKGMMPAGSSEVIETTTMFSPGDCFVMGDACPIPLKIHVDLAKERPQSKTIPFWEEWKKEQKKIDYKAFLEEYLKR